MSEYVEYKPDVRIENHGSILLVHPLTDKARDWLTENTDGQWFGSALSIEPRYVESLVEGLECGGGFIVTRG